MKKAHVGKEIGGRRNENDIWTCRGTKLDKIRNERIRGTTKVGGNRKESPGNEVEVVWTCDKKRRALRRKEGDGNESTREKEERKT